MGKSFKRCLWSRNKVRLVHEEEEEKGIRGDEKTVGIGGSTRKKRRKAKKSKKNKSDAKEETLRVERRTAGPSGRVV
jgi:hypothetical protein